MLKKVVSAFLMVCLLAAITSTALAANFTASVTGKQAPAVSAETTQSGEQAAAIIRDAQGSEVMGVPFGELIVTPVSEAHEADEDIKTRLIDAYDQILNVETLDELNDELVHALTRLSDEVGVEDLVVRDLFDVTVRGTYKEALDIDGNSITVTFDLGIDPDSLLMVLHNIQGVEWETVPENRIQRGEDGSVSVTFYSLSPVAFVVDSAKIVVDPNAPSSPQTGEADITLPALVASAVLAVVAVAIIGVDNRKKNQI